MVNSNGVEWQVKITSPFHPFLYRKDGSLSIGACDNNEKTIFISEDLEPELMKKVLCHEITHAAMFSYNVMLDEQEEELLADLLATYGQEIIDVTNKIFNRIKEQRN